MSAPLRVGIDLVDGLVRGAVLNALRGSAVEPVVGEVAGGLVVHADARRGDRRRLLVVPVEPRACRAARDALVEGRAGGVVTTAELDTLPAALQALDQAVAWVPHAVLAVAANAPEPTDRQARILRELQRGATNRAIARELAISPTTVKRELQALRALFGVRSRAELVIASFEGGWGRRLVAV